MAAVATGVDERLLIGGEWVEASGGGRFDVTEPATARSSARCPTRARRRARGDQRGRRRARRVAGDTTALKRARMLRSAAEVIRERARRDRARDDPRAGQAARRGEGRGRVRRQLHRVVRGRGGAHLRRDRAAAEREQPRPRAAPAGRRRRRDHALELPGRDDDPQARPGDGGRLHEHRQARLRDAADGGRRSCGHRGRGRAAGRRQPRHVALVGHGRRAAVRRPARPQDLVHRLDRGRQGADPAARPTASSGCGSSSAATRRT